jgi:uncharacterized membrane protein YcfT
MDQVIISDTNETPLVQIITWFSLVTSVLAVITQASIKIYTSRSIGLETVFIILALVRPSAQYTEKL